MKKVKISTAAFLAGVTTLAVSLPAVSSSSLIEIERTEISAEAYLAGEADFEAIDMWAPTKAL